MTASYDSLGNAPFADRHIGPRADDLAKMLAAIGVGSLDDLIDEAVPSSIRWRQPLAIGAALSETEALNAIRVIAGRNRVVTSMIGQGYHATITPPVVLRNVLENPAWYTSYTPYQPEISQGRLEALLNFQTMVAELTGMDIAGASMLDDATAAAEAMTLARRSTKTSSNRFLVDAACHPQVIDVVITRAIPLGIEVVVAAPTVAAVNKGDGVFAVLLAHPGTTGELPDHGDVVAAVHQSNGLVCVHTDLLACAIITPPGEWGADIVVGSAQRFGVPMGFGGPHAGFLAVREPLKRSLPGRLVGVSVDTKGRTAFRLALQTREQHIRREKATSNICTAQALLANMAGFYAVWHGPEGLQRIAERAHRGASILASAFGDALVHRSWFDTVTVRVDSSTRVLAAALENGVNLRQVDHATVGITCDELSTTADLAAVIAAVSGGTLTTAAATVQRLDAELSVDTDSSGIDAAQRRTTPPLRHEVFNRHRSEHEMLRYLRRLSDKDLAMDRTMIPLGSCTMKLNATSEMMPITWPELSNLHPFAPVDQVAGSLQIMAELEAMLVELTGYDAVSLQPNAGSQGEFAGLLAIAAYHSSRGEAHRTVCLIPSSAHGTNAASATMAGMKVVVVSCDDAGNVDIDDLRSKISTYGANLGALMITYPSTHGVFEDAITDICALVHDAGGQVYLDGANFNALVGVGKPGKFGADVSHLNLHKTFCIPHGGGGPGVGPVCVRAHLAPFLPGAGVVGNVSAAPQGSAGILPIPWMYITMMGGEGLRDATAVAILAANYVAMRLGPHFPVLYTGNGGRVAHECILDLRPITAATGVSADDVAKRLVDYGFHAPTMSFPVGGTLMVEPTESESLEELDRFCEAMIAIRAEIDDVANGVWPADDNPLCNAPHPSEDVATDTWAHAYGREQAAFPLATIRGRKYWPPVSRIDGAYGDRNVMCSCPPIDSY